MQTIQEHIHGINSADLEERVVSEINVLNNFPKAYQTKVDNETLKDLKSKLRNKFYRDFLNLDLEKQVRVIKTIKSGKRLAETLRLWERKYHGCGWSYWCGHFERRIRTFISNIVTIEDPKIRVDALTHITRICRGYAPILACHEIAMVEDLATRVEAFKYVALFGKGDAAKEAVDKIAEINDLNIKTNALNYIIDHSNPFRFGIRSKARHYLRNITLSQKLTQVFNY